jgi:8-oxo-dGTP pyrophosphatase MutT (NUDIX family)
MMSGILGAALPRDVAPERALRQERLLVSDSVAVRCLKRPMPGSGPEIVALERVEIAVAPWRWEFAYARADEITRHFAARRRERPALWNGRVLLVNHFAVADGVLRGTSFETDYASFLAWRDWGRPDASVCNVFAATALQAADGAYLVGRMAPFTSIAGQWLFPCGTPDPKDVRTGMLDLPGSARRELLEETGLDIGMMRADAGWTMVRDNGFVALVKRVVAAVGADDLRARIVRYLASEVQPEFSDIRILRSMADVDGDMPRFLRAYLAAVWSRQLSAMPTPG